MTDEQKKIVDSNNKYISISATAGSGKTFTLVKRVQKKLRDNKNKKKILVISFTNAAVNEIKHRVRDFNTDRLEVRTFDSLFQNLFFNFQYLTTGRHLDRNEINILYPKAKSMAMNNMLWANSLYNEKKLYANDVFKSNLNKLLFDSVRKEGGQRTSDKIINYLSSTYDEILVDESQDMDIWQIGFIRNIAKNTKIKITLFRDYSQSIFRFRGASPHKLKEFEQEFGFLEYKLEKGFRCKEDIYEIANNFRIENSKITKIEDIEEIIFNSNTENVFAFKGNREKILKENSKYISSLNEKYTNAAFIISMHSQTNEIRESDEFKDYRDSSWPLGRDLDLEDMTNIYFNNDLTLLFSKYDFEHDKEKIDFYQKTLYYKYLATNQKTPENFLHFLSCMLRKFEMSDDNIVWNNEVLISSNFQKLEKWAISREKKIITYFSVKGLEYDLVFLYLNKWELKKSIESRKSKDIDSLLSRLFVSMTRAKKKLVIFWIDN